jgi:hypothetical protein
MFWKKRDEKVERRLRQLQASRDRSGANYKSPFDQEPPVLTFVTDQEWRRPTSSRHIEELKRELRALEANIEFTRKSLVDQRESSKRNSGFIVATAYRLGMIALSGYIEHAQELVERIDRIFRGDVKREILELETEIERIETVGDHDSFSKSTLVDLRASLRELQTGNTEVRTPDQKQMNDYLERRKLDHRHKVEEEIGSGLRVREEVIMFKKRRRKEIMENEELNDPEKLNLMDELDEQCERYLKDLKDQVEVYEEG